jgi:DNA replication protein DnaC
LLLVGSPGTGKTHLAVAALRILIGKGFEGLFFDYKTLLDRIRTSYDPTSGQSDKEVYRSVLDAEVLLLDDLGAHRINDWVEDTVTSIITHRCNQQRPLIATTNLPDAMLQDQAKARRLIAVERRNSQDLRLAVRTASPGLLWCDCATGQPSYRCAGSIPTQARHAIRNCRWLPVPASKNF